MGEDDPEVKRLAELKTYLERRLAELDREAEHVKGMLELVDKALTDKSFRKPQLPEQPMRRIRGRTGTLLATMTVEPHQARIVFNPEIRVTQDMRPFSSFLLRKVLDSMKESDRQKIEEGKMEPGSGLDYEVIYDGETAREVIVKNYRDDNRLREIVNSVKWTLDTIAAESR
ncbi:hypothetical protein HRbin01_01192 [archaeon HR01]|nr:hypothetical protein HRbin01_01192 [archaeon HR01]